MEKTPTTPDSNQPGQSIAISLLSVIGIAMYLWMVFGTHRFNQPVELAWNVALSQNQQNIFAGQYRLHFLMNELPLVAVLVCGGIPLLYGLIAKLLKANFGADLLAGISIITAILLHQLLAGSLVVLMLSGGAVLELYAVRKASSVLQALANRMPSIAHKKTDTGKVDIPIDQINIGDILVMLPHELCPVDGTVIEGSGSMDESYLTGEPYRMAKTIGSAVMSGAINGDTALTIRADKIAADSRYAKIMTVMRDSEQHRPKLRRLGDQLGALYTPLALVIAVIAWFLSGDAMRFLSVLVIATPCPLLIAIPVALISTISLAAQREIIIKNPAVLETLDQCRTAIFDKTGTLTYGRPVLTATLTRPGYAPHKVLALVASLERYSKHPLASAIIKAAESNGLQELPVTSIQEEPGSGLHGEINGQHLQITSRKQFLLHYASQESLLPAQGAGLECVVLIDHHYAATLQFRDEVRLDSSSFISHLKPNHLFDKIMIVSGDRESEVRYLAEQVGIQSVYFNQSPEQKLAIVRAETQAAKTVYLGDGINDAPALAAATIGIAFGQNSDVTGEAADAVIMDSSLLKVDELLHIGQRMRKIALQSAIGGMVFSLLGMFAAGYGYLTPVAGAVLQEIIDVFAVLNALRAAFPPRQLSDF